MPRDGSGIYTKPYPDVVTGTTIASVEHNGTVNDIATDLNAVRPIVAGGTGANNATSARDNLDVEVAGKEVTNYDSHIWEHGSFWSQSTATGEPVDGQFFTGNATLINNDQGYVILNARSYNDGKSYYRIKTAGVWGTWKADGADDFVNVTGDTMTGNLTILQPTPAFATTTYAISGGRSWAVGIHPAGYFSINDQAVPAERIVVDDGGSLYIRAPGALYVGGGLVKITGMVNPSVTFNNGYREWFVGGNAGGYGVDLFTIFDSSAGAMRLTINAAGSINAYTNILSSGTTTGTLTVAGGVGVAGAVNAGNINVWGGGDGVYAIYSAGTHSGQFSANTGAAYLDFRSYLLFRDIAAGHATRASFGGSGLDVIGNISAGNNAGVPSMLIAGGGGAGDGALIRIHRGGAATWVIGNHAAIYGSGGLPDFTFWNPTTGPSLVIENATGTVRISSSAGSTSTTTGALVVTGGIGVGGSVVAGDISRFKGIFCHYGTGGAYTSHAYNILFDSAGASVPLLYVDTTNMGQFAFVSDYRIKKDVAPLDAVGRMWDRVKSLRPIRYTQTDYGNLFKADDTERWGFLAHELQETLTPSAATGTKDEDNLMQSPNPWTVIAALTGALQEAMTRIEALEA